jgi:hypothetical protein
MRRSLFTAALCTFFAICAGVAAADGGPSPGTDFGYRGIVGPGGQLRYVSVIAGNTTIVEAIRMRDARIQRFTPLKGDYGVPYVTNDGTTGGLSRDGGTLVLASYATSPGAGAATRFAVMDTSPLRLRRLVTLRGSYSFDALSPDAKTMYLIQYTSARNYNRYRVRAYDLVARRLLAHAIVDKSEPKEVMAGWPVTRVTTADGAWVYTLYARPSGPSFIHALDTVGRRAVCLDLDLRAITSVRLRLTSDGKQILLRQRNGIRLASVRTPA